ncbi:hypothetical protein BD560DRAFT_402750 [Blakeslea trispora]|nr:hypothetical protein BD560DRAFT_402750 [Blakeslea trispora]
MALMSLNVSLSVFSALEVIDGRRWLNTLNNLKNKHAMSLDTAPIQNAFYVEIALCAFVGTFGALYSHFSIAVTREIGWVIYRKIGADLSVQRMYRTIQFYVLAVKINIFTEFIVSVFYLLQYALKSGFNTWKTFVFVIITILILPMLVFGRNAIARESKAQMAVFIFFQGCVMFQLILIAIEAAQSEDNWYIWFCFIALGLVVAVLTIILATLCQHNFGKGLKPFVQRGAGKKEVKLPVAEPNKDWNIDED